MYFIQYYKIINDSEDIKKENILSILHNRVRRDASTRCYAWRGEAMRRRLLSCANKGEQMARYYGLYSNVARGKRKKTDADDKIPCFLEPVESLKVERPELTGKTFRRNWA